MNIFVVLRMRLTSSLFSPKKESSHLNPVLFFHGVLTGDWASVVAVDVPAAACVFEPSVAAC